MWLIAAIASSVAAPSAEPHTVSFPVALPAGVTTAPTARELTKPRPAGVTFSIDGSPTVRDGVLVVRGALANTGTRTAVVHLVSAPHTGGPFLLAPRGVPYRPVDGAAPLPEAPPAPVELVLPAGARVVYESGIRLDRWAWPATGEVDLDWSFQFWTNPATGTLPGKLKPPR